MVSWFFSYFRPPPPSMVVLQSDIPIDFDIPFGERRIELVCKVTEGPLISLHATIERLISQSDTIAWERYIDKNTGKDLHVVGTPCEKEILKHMLKMIYGVDTEYNRPFSEELSLELYKGADAMGFKEIRRFLIAEAIKDKNYYLGFLMDLPKAVRKQWLKEMAVCEIIALIKHPEYRLRRGANFTDSDIEMMVYKFQKDKERSPFSGCFKCGKNVHPPRLVFLTEKDI